MNAPLPVGGSFRDPAARVYDEQGRILRGVNAETLADFQALAEQQFFTEAIEQGQIVSSNLLDATDDQARQILALGWAGVLEHERLPLLSYPYEWTFSMLKDAALLHLQLLEKALKAGWTIKDSTPYNIQFVGAVPTFIDIPSFVRRPEGDYWRGYRQFCMTFLYPLMLTAYGGVPFHGLLRSSLDGISSSDAARMLTGFKRLKKGVLSHVVFPAAMESRTAKAKSSGEAAAKPQSDAMVIGLVQSMARVVEALPTPSGESTWSDYTESHSYDESAFDDKTKFVSEAVAGQHFGISWDLGCNTGTFSEILAGASDQVVSLDGDHECVERLYLRLRERGDRKILPLTMNLANPSPNQGWAGAERTSFDSRNTPDLIISLALIHHICLTANVPIPDYLDWLLRTGAKLIIEFVDRDDVMVKEMLARKTETHEDYNLENFERELALRYEILQSTPLKQEGERKIYFCRPKG